MKKIQLRFAMGITLLMLTCAPAMAQPGVGAGDSLTRPTMPVDSFVWVGPMLIIISAMFLMAMVIGPAVRAEMAAQPAITHDDHANDAHSHDGHGH